MNDYLERVEAQLTELTERGAHLQHPQPGPVAPASRRGQRPPLGPGGPRRRRRGSEALAILAAVAVAAAVAAIVVLNVHTSKPKRTSAQATTTHKAATAKHPPTPATHPPASSLPIPAKFAPQSFTAIGELTWWLLGPAPQCNYSGESPPCGAILRTTDGGRHFVAVGAPRATLTTSASTGSSYSQLRFADTKNGFAYGPGLYVTHDGGQSWHAVDVGGTVTDLVISAGQAFATVQPSGGGNGQLMHVAVSRDDWSTASAAGAVSSGLWAQGAEVIVQSGVGTGVGGNVLVSSDGGQSFTAHPAPSPGLPCQFAAPEPPVVWAHCATGTESGVWHSSDGGATFSIAAGTGTSLPLPNSAAFAAASATTAVVGFQKLYRTTNGGALWDSVVVPGVTQLAYLGFTDTTHGVALGYVGSVAPANERLFYTTDAGQSYHLVHLP